MPDAVVGYIAEDAVDEVVDTTDLAQPERGTDVLGLDMKSRRDRFADLMAVRRVQRILTSVYFGILGTIFVVSYSS